MSNYFLTMGISFVVILVFAGFLNFCRRRIRKTPHGLSGMCHKNGGAICTSCQEQIEKDSSSP